MRVAIANMLDVFVHVQALVLSPLSVEIVISSEKHLSTIGSVVGYACLQPGTALTMRQFDDRTRFCAAFLGFGGKVIESTLREWRSAEHGECITLTLHRFKTSKHGTAN